MPAEVYVGRVRSAVLLILLSIVTLGLWAFVWLYQLNRDLRRHLTVGVSPAARLIGFLLLPVVGWFVVTYLTARSVRRVQINAGADRIVVPIYPSIFVTLLPLVGLLIALAYLQGGANRGWLAMTNSFQPGSLTDSTVQCPDCDTRFATLLNPLLSHAIACPHCGRTGEV